MIADPIERFMQYVSHEPNTGCWLWSGHSQFRYGRFHFNGWPKMAHRVAYELFRGPIPEGMEVDHKCRMTYCVNPDHLEVVTPRINRQRQGAAVTKCPQGHEHNDRNTSRYQRTGHRRCLVCHREREAIRKAIRRGQLTGG